MKIDLVIKKSKKRIIKDRELKPLPVFQMEGRIFRDEFNNKITTKEVAVVESGTSYITGMWMIKDRTVAEKPPYYYGHKNYCVTGCCLISG